MPQLDSSKPGASIQVSAKAKKTSAYRIATLRKRMFIVVNEPGLMHSSIRGADSGGGVATCSRADVNNGAALDLFFEQSLDDCGHPDKTNHMRRSRGLAQIQLSCKS